MRDTIKMITRRAAEKSSAKWSAEAFGEGGYEVVPPEKEEEFRKMAEEDNRRRRPGMYADDDVATGTPAQGRSLGCRKVRS